MDGTLTAAPTQQQPSTQEIKFRKLLEELFMFDQADLDFGIYRIMNAKRDEITRFLESELLPQAREALGAVESGDRAELKAELEQLEKTLRAAGVDPEQSPKVKELREKYGSEPDHAALEAEVFSHLYSFFRRYYSEGDFISQRRYKAGVYAIPYEGEEVKLHWANHDQYYIKTGENFRDYAFRLPDGRRVHFRLTDADTERNNNKATEGQERRFTLVEDQPVVEENGELVIRFAYQPDEKKRKQANLNDEAVKRIRAAVPASWRTVVEEKAPTEKDANRLLLEKHLNDYTARNSFDYFIHKDLGGFLRRELDFYLKNEVVHLDDIELESAPRVEQYLGKVRAIRRIAHQIIDILAQLEDFQKRLWLKKKFVVETSYCITLDRVPEDLYPEIAANEAQREEWVRLFAIDEIEKDLARPGYSAPLTVDFLKANPFLVLDTEFFDERFRDRLLASIEDLDEQTDGLLVHSENFQALNLLQARYSQEVKCIYIDPPYNTGQDGFPYRDSYQHSSWLSMIRDRVCLSSALVSPTGSVAISIDDVEQSRLSGVLGSLLGESNYIANIVRENAYVANQTAQFFSNTHDYVLVFARDTKSVTVGRIERTEEQIKKFQNPDGDPRGPWKAENLSAGKYYSAGQFEITGPTGKRFNPPPGRYWRCNKEQYESWLAEGRITFGRNGSGRPMLKKYLSEVREGLTPSTWWPHTFAGSNKEASLELKALGSGFEAFTTPKPVKLVRRLVALLGSHDALVLDFFAGSGTTGHGVIDLNREDSGHRKYALIEMGGYFDTVLKPRIQKVIYSNNWKDGRPVSREGSSHTFKYIRLESYEDTLNNLELKRSAAQQELLDTAPDFRSDYMLRYMLDVETRDSASLLSLEQFEDPFSYELKIGTGSAGETRPVKVDLVETFNYLLGLRVRHIDRIRGIRVVQGTSPEGERVLVIWRNTREVSSADLDAFFRKQDFNPRDAEFDIIYVNGDNNLENLRRPDETWKVRLIEEEFLSRMFDVRDV